MGLLKAGIGALSSVLADEWREYIYCDSMSTDVLVEKGKKRTSKKSSNTKGSENVISNGSIVAVNEGQCMIIVDQGKVVDLCAETGEYVYDISSEPSIFYGNLGENIKATFAKIGMRFGFGGDAGKDQRVYFFNTKEITGNKYGTVNPVPFRVVDNNIGLDMDISIRCHGEYSYHIIDPMLFYTNVCGNINGSYTRDTIDSQLKSELLTAMQPAFAKISEAGIRYSALPGHAIELSDALNEVLSNKWKGIRGIEIVSFGVTSVTASEEDEKMIKELQKNATFRNPNMAAAHLVGAQAQAMQDAAKNTSTGPMMAFAGMNMASQAGGASAQDLFSMGQQMQPSQPNAQQMQASQPNAQQMPGKSQSAANATWQCSCGAANTGNFCTNCGAKRPNNCCSNCGWKPSDPSQKPKFCPECGTPFN